MTKQTMHCIVSGKVQGVFYRAETQRKARELGVVGWVRNLPTGEVELVATGSIEQLAEMAVWLEQGPEMARVDNVVRNDVALEDSTDFQVRYD